MSAINIVRGIPYELNKGGRHFADTVKTLARSYRLNNKGEGSLGTYSYLNTSTATLYWSVLSSQESEMSGICVLNVDFFLSFYDVLIVQAFWRCSIFALFVNAPY